MDLSKILSISGKAGLYKVVSQLKNAVLVESLTDQKRFPAFAHEKISSLQEISVYTTGEDRSIKDIFKAIFDKMDGKTAIDPKSDIKGLTSFFLEVVPDYDMERVYISDIRKIISWYNLLLEHNLLDFTEKEEEKNEESAEENPESLTPLAESFEKKKKTSSGKPRSEGKSKKPAPVKKTKKTTGDR